MVNRRGRYIASIEARASQTTLWAWLYVAVRKRRVGRLNERQSRVLADLTSRQGRRICQDLIAVCDGAPSCRSMSTGRRITSSAALHRYERRLADPDSHRARVRITLYSLRHYEATGFYSIYCPGALAGYSLANPATDRSAPLTAFNCGFYARQLYRQVLLTARISYGNSVRPSVRPGVTTRYRINPR